MLNVINFDALKEGDKVLLHNWGGFYSTKHCYKAAVVVKKNKTTFKLNCTAKTFNRNGNIYGGSEWETCNVVEYDEEFYTNYLKEVEEKKTKTKLIEQVGGVQLENLSIEQLQSIVDIIYHDEKENA